MRHPILTVCIILCLLSVGAYLLFGRGSQSNPSASRFFEAMKNNPEDAISVCKAETPFKSGERTYWAHQCILEVACKLRPTSIKKAVDACREMDSLPVIAGDENISSDTCIAYTEKNC